MPVDDAKDKESGQSNGGNGDGGNGDVGNGDGGGAQSVTFIMELAKLKHALEQRPCHCGSRQVNLWPSSCKGVIIRMRCQCVKCNHEFDVDPLPGNFNEVFYTSLMANGISTTQCQRTLWALNFAGESAGGTFAVDVNSRYNAELRKTIMPVIVELARSNQSEALEECINSISTTIELSVDGCYPVRFSVFLVRVRKS